MGALKKVLMPHTMIKGSKKFDPIFGSGKKDKNPKLANAIGGAGGKFAAAGINPGIDYGDGTSRVQPRAKPNFAPPAMGGADVLGGGGMNAGIGGIPAPPEAGAGPSSQFQLQGMADQLMGAGYQPQASRFPGLGGRMIR